MQEGYTPLHLAAQGGSQHVAATLLSKGAPVGAETKVCTLLFAPYLNPVYTIHWPYFGCSSYLLHHLKQH
jgi:hypothetical protein